MPTRRDVLAAMAAGAISMAPAAPAQRRPAPRAPVHRYRVVRAYPHDPAAFTQGLIFHDGALYEGTGLVGRSTLRKVHLESGEVLQVRRLDPELFGEGITAWDDTLVQLTWQSGVGFVYDRATFRPLRRFRYTGEGWGLTHDTRHLILSDGSASLRYLDPRSFREIRRLTVRDGGQPVSHLNELEWVRGEIFANVWQTERIARISPSDGRVTAWIDLHGLLDTRDAAGVDVLNGIAYDASRDRLFVTGKLWPKLFEITIL
jgi:glutaminyl-peptide cyclotransferase